MASAPYEAFRKLDSRGTKRVLWGKVFPDARNPSYLVVHGSDGTGTKSFIAEALNEHESIGRDLVAMVVNDAIRFGAKPEHVTLTFDVRKKDPRLLKQLAKGVFEAARDAGVHVAGGETAGVPEMSLRHHSSRHAYVLNASGFGRVHKNNLVSGKNIRQGDVIIGLPSSGLHSNGYTLARKILVREWGGRYGLRQRIPVLGRPLGEELLTPTIIYVKPVLQLMKQVPVKAAVHVTGGAYKKFAQLFEHSRGIGLRFHTFRPQPIFELIQETSRELGKPLSGKRMFSEFNMGWGFALIVSRQHVQQALAILRRFGEEPQVIGKVTGKLGKIEVEYKGRRFSL